MSAVFFLSGDHGGGNKCSSSLRFLFHAAEISRHHPTDPADGKQVPNTNQGGQGILVSRSFCRTMISQASGRALSAEGVGPHD
jgi:hypothetical protein